MDIFSNLNGDALIVAFVVVIALAYVALIDWVLAKSQASRLTKKNEPMAA